MVHRYFTFLINWCSPCILGGLLRKVGRIAAPVTGMLTGNPWIGAAASGLASIGSSAISARQSRDSAKFATAAGQDFAREMSNTAVQRRMADLKKAGINPILAGTYEASSPSVMGPAANIPDFGTSVAQGINSGVSFYLY